VLLLFCINLLLGDLFVIFTLCNACAFTCRSSMEPSCIMNILPCYLVYPRDGIRLIGWLCFVNRPSAEVEWLIAARDMAPSHYGGSM
jgi:hypothetical protein